MIEDAELLRRYASEKSQAAFAELVERRIGLVYSVALRQCGGDAHLAEDVTQKVFADLARKAAQLSERLVLSGWLCRSAQFAASDLVRAERRRRTREMETSTMHDLSTNPANDDDWSKLRPVLDQVMNELDDDDRDAVALRFFEGRAFADIARALRLTEEAARKRVDRALDRLHAALAKRGVTSTTAALGVALANQAGVAAPAGLVASITGAAFVGGAAAALTMTTTAKLALALAAAILVTGGTIFVQQQGTNEQLRAEVNALKTKGGDLARLREENLWLARENTEVAMLRGDDAELAAMQKELADLGRTRPPAAPIALASAGEVAVAGSIKIPGSLKMPAPGQTITLREIIDQAGGLTDLAKRNGIRVSRTMPDGTMKVFTLDYTTDATRFTLQPNDIVYVPERIL